MGHNDIKKVTGFLDTAGPREVPGTAATSRKVVDGKNKPIKTRPSEKEALHFVNGKLKLQPKPPINWAKAGLSSKPGQFREFSYFFETKEDSTNPPFITPFHEVHLSENPETSLPWTDPILLREWEAFLEKDLGMTITREGQTKKYTYKGYTVMTREDDLNSNTISFKLFNPQGNVERSTILKKPKPLETVVLRDGVSENGLEKYIVKIGDKKINVSARFPKGTNPERVEKVLKELGNVLQELPEELKKLILEGRENEGPASIVLSDVQTARELNILRSPSFGIFDRELNQVWLKLFQDEKTGKVSFSRGVLAHELIGHGIDDFLVSSGLTEGVTNRKNSAIADFYLWKISNIFSPKELAEYTKLTRRLWALRNNGQKGDWWWKRVTKKLDPYRKKVENNFVSYYAVEGADFTEQINEAREYYAESALFNYAALNNPKNLEEIRWKNVRGRDEFTRLITLHYLFSSYNVEQIGNIEREEVYSAKAFKELFGVDLSQMEEVRKKYLSPH